MSKYAKIMNRLRVMYLVNVVMLVLLIVLLGVVISDRNKIIHGNEELKSTISALNDTVVNSTKAKTKAVIDNADLCEDLAKTATSLYMVTGVMEEMESTINIQQEEIKELTDKVNLYEEYSYAITDKYNNRTDITAEQIQLVIDLCKDRYMSDADMILAWVMTESHGKSNARNPRSTAKGYAQFLDGTSKSVYNSLDYEESWTNSVALDGDTCLTMMVQYVNQLVEAKHGDLNAAIDSYRGLHSDSYIAEINSYLKVKGKSVSSIAKETMENYKKLNQ